MKLTIKKLIERKLGDVEEQHKTITPNSVKPLQKCEGFLCTKVVPHHFMLFIIFVQNIHYEKTTLPFFNSTYRCL